MIDALFRAESAWLSHLAALDRMSRALPMRAATAIALTDARRASADCLVLAKLSGWERVSRPVTASTTIPQVTP